MLEKREREFAKKVKGIHKEVTKMKLHEKYLEEKLPKIRAEAEEVKKDQPVKFGRKRPKGTQYKMKDAMAAAVRVEKIDVNEIMKKAKERAAANPKPVAATKNKKRKFQEFQNTHGKDVVHYDYGYDSDDDIWA